ncbi:glutamate-5-semialdehyde dehydrogenase [bacterium]
MDIRETVIRQAMAAKAAQAKLSLLDNNARNKILNAIADSIEKNKDDILFKNEIDVTAAKDAGLSKALVDRLMLNEKRISAMAHGIRQITSFSDPIGEELETSTRPNGLVISKIAVPLGVIGIIYESRPNVTIDSIALCLKAGNAVILRGGTEALNSNHTLVKAAAEAAYQNGLPAQAIQFIETPDREAVREMLQLDKFIDVIIPRGGEKMMQSIIGMSKIPVIQHGRGICHTYIDKSANIDMAVNIAYNAKVHRPGVCNAMETLIVHKDIAKDFLPVSAEKFIKAGVELRGCEATAAILKERNISINSASVEDWDTEYLDLILSIKTVDNIDEAIKHINRYGTGHSEAIVADDSGAAEKFLQEVDASSVYHNASTRFTDGEEFGLGAEIGISTQKLHARGPMGIKQLTSYRYIVKGTGQVRE